MKSIFLVSLIPLLGMCAPNKPFHDTSQEMNQRPVKQQKTDTATFGAGCFWCTEAVFSQLDGVISVTSGYSGGTMKNPSYDEVCTGLTGHAEVARIIFDTTRISYDELLQVFWAMHDPTSVNRQGADQGPQYRSVVFFHNEGQRLKAIEQIAAIDDAGIYDRPIVTEINPAGAFYPAEEYHRDYYNLNPGAPYCQIVIQPKTEKIRKLFAEKLKK